MGDGEQKRAQGAPFGVVLLRLVPEGDEGLLDDVLCKGLVFEDPPGHAFHRGAMLLEGELQRRPAA